MAKSVQGYSSHRFSLLSTMVLNVIPISLKKTTSEGILFASEKMNYRKLCRFYRARLYYLFEPFPATKS